MAKKKKSLLKQIKKKVIIKSRGEPKRVYHKKLTEIGETVPSNFKFGLIVAVAIIWLDFVKTLVSLFFERMHPTTLSQIWTWPAIRDFVIAAVVTLIAYLVLMSYRKIRNRVAKVKVPV